MQSTIELILVQQKKPISFRYWAILKHHWSIEVVYSLYLLFLLRSLQSVAGIHLFLMFCKSSLFVKLRSEFPTAVDTLEPDMASGRLL